MPAIEISDEEQQELLSNGVPLAASTVVEFFGSASCCQVACLRVVLVVLCVHGRSVFYNILQPTSLYALYHMGIAILGQFSTSSWHCISYML